MNIKLNFEAVPDLIGTPEQWEEIAAAFDVPYKRRHGRQLEIAHGGLCYAIRQLTGSDAFYKQGVSLYYSIDDSRWHEAEGLHWFGLDAKGDRKRAYCARLIAAEIRRRNNQPK